MGFKDVEWAYSAGRPLAETAVLAALCLRTDDKTHETFVGQKTVANMLGSSPEKVLRSLGVLERAGIISRTRRHGRGGYRTSDLIRVNVDTYQAERLQGEMPTRQNAYKEIRRDLPDDSSAPTWQKVTAKEITQSDHSVDHSDTPDRFDEFYAVWPKKVDKPAARRAWAKAIKRATPEQIITAATAYRDNPNLPEKRYIRNPATWLNGDGWDDELPTARNNTLDNRRQQTLAAGHAYIQSRRGLAPVTPLKEIS